MSIDYREKNEAMLSRALVEILNTKDTLQVFEELVQQFVAAVNSAGGRMKYISLSGWKSAGACVPKGVDLRDHGLPESFKKDEDQDPAFDTCYRVFDKDIHKWKDQAFVFWAEDGMNAEPLEDEGTTEGFKRSLGMLMRAYSEAEEKQKN